MYEATVRTFRTRAYLAVVASLVTLVAVGEAQAVPINSAPGAITCTVGEPGGVGDDFEGFLDTTTGQPEIELEGFDSVECGPNEPGVEPPPPMPPIDDPLVFVNDRPYLTAAYTDIDLHGLYRLHGMYGFYNNGVYGVYNLHGTYNVQGILHDGILYNFDRYGDAAAPLLVPEPTAAWLLGAGLLGLLARKGVRNQKR